MIPVRQKVFDTLHWVQPTQLGPQVQTDCTIPNSKEEVLQTIDRLNSTINNVVCKSIFGQDTKEIAEEPTEVRNYSTAFIVSEDAIKFMTTTIKNDLTLKKTFQTESLSPQATFFHFIFMGSSIAHHQIDVGYSCINLLSVDGGHASIKITPISGMTRSTNGSPMEVTLHCSCVPLLCRLHESMLTRLKPLITCGTSRNQMRAYDVQKQLEKLQDLHKCVILLEDEMSMGTDKRESIAVKRTLWALYEKMRGVILMI